MKTNPLYRRFKITDDEIVTADDGEKLLLKSAIIKIKRKLNIEIKIDWIEEHMITHHNNTDFAVSMKGSGTMKNSKGFVVDRNESTASANPYNCSFPHKMETCEKRLMSRLVLDLAELDEYKGIHEINMNDKKYKADTPGNKVLKEAVKKLQDNKKEAEPLKK